ncbi:uncharacterized protein LOC120648347 isoform X2 [Panicum virgatum]|uniref:Uncharacterized protein n=1 Tax=Panicum virgatum TaxID=38727 RepID=A0A8T0NDH5_PANVG|nr:uncharacterized protein LOC120648347 isoform X2 [Panicum virgatum]KAG2546895.1 hypothetical protein PVAP13_9KG051057 [Panicum virgatum]
MWCSDSKQTLKSRGAGAAGATMGNEESDNFSPTLHKDWSMGLLKLVTATVIFMGGGVPRWTTPSSTSTSATATKNLHQMSSLLEMLDDPDVPTRELALSLLVEILEKHRKAMESCIEILIVKLLHATKDAALKAISSQLPCQDEKIIISINSLSKLVNRLSQENLMAHLSTFLPALLDAFENHSPYIRKSSNLLVRPAQAKSTSRSAERTCIFYKQDEVTKINRVFYVVVARHLQPSNYYRSFACLYISKRCVCLSLILFSFSPSTKAELLVAAIYLSMLYAQPE